ncbi:hypothetical protein GGI07_003565 [Coemansia sp. Benny D115]|nr:hypothetical protein GGI07_003565 [Coemansia sp. Benny D115]
MSFASGHSPVSGTPPAQSPAHTPQPGRTAAAVFPGPQPLVARNGSMMGLPSRSPEAHRHQMLRRAHSQQQQQQQQVHWVTDTSTTPRHPRLGSPTYAFSGSPPASLRNALGSHSHYSPAHMHAASPHSALRSQHQSPLGRKRLSGGGGVSGEQPATPRRIRRRLFFEDDSAASDAERRREAGSAALAIIRDAVEVGDGHIDLSDLGLDSVPDELAELKDLVVLTPSHTMASDLQLSLSTNRLAHFPMAVCELSNLTTLILSNNRITLLPPEIANLRALRELSVAHNQLRSLPIELTRLALLQTLTVFPNPFASPPPPSEPSPKDANGALQTWPHALALTSAGVPRLSDLAARRLSRVELAALKQRLAQCLGILAPSPALGRIVGPALEPEDGSVLAALRAQHLAVPEGHLCAACGQWFLLPAAEVTVWAPMPPLLTRPVPFRIRLCSRNCVDTPVIASVLRKP